MYLFRGLYIWPQRNLDSGPSFPTLFHGLMSFIGDVSSSTFFRDPECGQPLINTKKVDLTSFRGLYDMKSVLGVLSIIGTITLIGSGFDSRQDVDGNDLKKPKKDFRQKNFKEL